MYRHNKKNHRGATKTLGIERLSSFLAISIWKSEAKGGL